MVKDENVARVDLRVPLGIFEKIELLSEQTNQPFTPKTKNSDNPKRAVTPIVLKLIELGLGVIGEDSSKLTQGLISRDVDNSETIENRLFERLEKRLSKRLEELLESKLGLFEALNKADTSPEIQENLSELPEIKEAIVENVTPEIVDEVKEVSALEVIEEIKETNSGNDTNETNIENEDKETIEVSKDIKSFEEAITEIEKLKAQGLGNTAIARSLTGKYFTKQSKTNWTDTQVKRLINTYQK